MPSDDVAFGPSSAAKDRVLKVCITLGLNLVKRRAASNRVNDDAQGLLLIHGRLHFAEAVCVWQDVQVLANV